MTVRTVLRIVPALLLALALGWAAGGGARAEGAVPRIADVHPETTFTGGVIELRGTNFSDAREDVTATVGGAPALVLEASVGRLKVMLPAGLEKGTHAIEVLVAGRRSNRALVKVVPQSERSKAAEDASKKYEHPESTPELAAKIVALAPPDPTEDRGSFFIRVNGEARLPDGCIVSLALKLGDEIVTAINLEVKDKRFQGAFGPYDKELFAGNYWVDAVFEIEKQTRQIRDVFRRTFTDPTDRAIHERAHDRQACRVGTAEQEIAQRKQVREHVAVSIVRVRRLTRRLENAVASAARGAFVTREPGKVDEPAWEAWLATRTLKNVPLADRAARIEEIKRGRGFAGPEGIFLESKWREWLDFGFRPEVNAVVKAHFDYKARFILIKYPVAMLKLEEVFGYVNTLAESRSRLLYKLCNLPEAPQDRDSKGVDMLQIGVGASNVTPGSIELAARKVAREIELTPEEEAAAEAAVPEEG